MVAEIRTPRMIVTINGRQTPRSRIQVRAWLYAVDVRIHLSTNTGKVGDPLALTLAGSPIFTGVITRHAVSWRHYMIDATPGLLLRMRSGVVGPLSGDAAKAVEIGRQILGVDPVMTDPTDVKLERWTTRKRTVGWAWESLLRTISGQISQPVGWRYSPRDDMVIAETDRANWRQIQQPASQRNAGASIIFPVSDIQPGDVLPDGRQVIYTETNIESNIGRTVARIEVPPA